jgi:tetratricopeptide (TPR) repeat protein
VTRAIATALAAAVLAAAPAFAEVPAQARQLAERGLVLHAAGNYDAAIAAFTEAYALAPSPALLFDLAQSYRLGGRCDDAAVMYRRFLATEPDADARGVAEAQLAALDTCVARESLVVTTPPIAAPAFTASGPRRDGHRLENVGEGIAIGGAGALAVAAFFAIRARDASEAVTTAYAHGGTWQAIVDTDERGHRDASLAAGFAATGGVAIVAGIAAYAIGVRRGHEVVIAPRPGGGEVRATWRF